MTTGCYDVGQEANFNRVIRSNMIAINICIIYVCGTSHFLKLCSAYFYFTLFPAFRYEIQDSLHFLGFLEFYNSMWSWISDVFR